MIYYNDNRHIKNKQRANRSRTQSKSFRKLATKFKQNDENYLSKKEAKERLATKSDIEKVRAEIANSKYTLIVWNAGMLMMFYGMIRFL